MTAPPRSAQRTLPPKATPMTLSRIPGLVLPAVFLSALVIGAFWYWRHRHDDPP